MPPGPALWRHVAVRPSRWHVRRIQRFGCFLRKLVLAVMPLVSTVIYEAPRHPGRLLVLLLLAGVFLLGERPDGYHGGTSTEFISNRADGRSCFSAALRLRRGASICRLASVAALLPACLFLTLGERPAASLSAQQDSSNSMTGLKGVW